VQGGSRLLPILISVNISVCS